MVLSTTYTDYPFSVPSCWCAQLKSLGVFRIRSTYTVCVFKSYLWLHLLACTSAPFLKVTCKSCTKKTRNRSYIGGINFPQVIRILGVLWLMTPQKFLLIYTFTVNMFKTAAEVVTKDFLTSGAFIKVSLLSRYFIISKVISVCNISFYGSREILCLLRGYVF